MLLENILTEDPNTSLMYYKLFPDTRIIKQLESFGFEFKMGSGQKILRKVLSRAHRARGSHTQRSLQTIVILHNGRFYREFTKQKWTSYIDPSSKDSKTYGAVFLDQLLSELTRQRDSRASELNINITP